MKFPASLSALLLCFITFLVSCKSDDDSGYIPLNIVARPDIGEVFQNSTLNIPIFDNDDNIPQTGKIVITTPEYGTAIIKDNGTPDILFDDFIQYTPNGTFVGEDSFEYTVCDLSEKSCATAKVTIEVMPFSPVNFDLGAIPYEKLSDYNFFQGHLAEMDPVYGVLPYEPINTLFSDYAHKKRFIWMPNQVSATYVSDFDNLNFPSGSVLIKTFYYENVLPNNSVRNIETRLLIKKGSEWIFANYIWDGAQQEAVLNTTGNGYNVPIDWIEKGEVKFVNYRIPSELECFICHKSFDAAIPIAPKPQNLNSIYNYADGMENQLKKWEKMGYLSQNNIPTDIRTVPNWKDISQGLRTRVRSYFDINCAHCHTYGGHCGARSLRLAYSQTDEDYNLGICVEPDLQIPGYNEAKLITPGHADNSILFFRVATTLEEYRMPMNGRTLVDEEFLPILEEWINSLSTPCN
ncbi:hypothetical protein EI546_02765 [Aequorivita sp. H23M31]|uniref:Cytochrome c domain-containing protein n=1 Tax=Aequorivita ciconiae TaxID=2494375 RepID=A0A410G0B4_9FLAO|nr:Ig-like domain-containing protein [Aequorivita sp. H23M31]QAA80714.1 hypothetical protein EI546_02765 [Aequorivita sp. H23M31]